MKNLITLLLVFVMGHGVAFSQQPMQINITKGENLPYLDGRGDDEIWKKMPAIPVEKRFGDEEPTVTAFFKMFYTDDFLYIYIDVTDDVHNPVWVGKKDSELSKDVHHLYDKVELYFDVNDILKDGKSPAYINGYMDPGHYQLAPYFEEDGYDFPYLLEGLLYGAMSNQAMVCYSLKDDYTSYSMEYEIPLNSFVNDKGENMSVGKFENLPNGMGFDVTIVDNDDDGKGRKRMVWSSDENEAYYNMDNAGVVRFGGNATGIGNVMTDDNGKCRHPAYNMLGQRVNENAKGLVISNGVKTYRK